jgi:hypothetical protein
LHEQFEVQAIGMLDRSAETDEPRVLFGSALSEETTLVKEDKILVYGQKEKLETMEIAADEI